MRARYLDRDGFVDRDGVRIFYEVYDNEEPTVALVPTTTIWNSRQWKTQIPYLARHLRIDGRGNGRSDRPESESAYVSSSLAQDIVAVLDATDTERAVLTSLCHAIPWTLDLAVRHQQRVSALIAVAPGVEHIAPAQPHYLEAAERWTEVLDRYRGWEMCNRHFWLTEYPTWLDFFIAELLPESHSTKQHEDAIGWGLGTTGAIRVAELAARSQDALDLEGTRALYKQVEQPVLVIHGDLDECQSVERGRALAALTGGDLVVFEDVGHAPQAREPVRFNLMVRDLVERVAA